MTWSYKYNKNEELENNGKRDLSFEKITTTFLTIMVLIYDFTSTANAFYWRRKKDPLPRLRTCTVIDFNYPKVNSFIL
jgi:hypothetical protein